jgi:O-antigen/teichoic acid export membrane protein
MITVTLIAIPAFAIVALLAPLLSDQLGVLDDTQMRAVLLSSVAIFTFNGFQSVLSCIPLGKRRMIPPNIAFAIGSAVNFAFSLAALAASTSLVVYAVANAAAALVALAPSYFAMRHVWGRPYWRMPSRELIREVLGFSIKDQVGWIAELINFETDKVVIALAVDIRAAAVYEIVSRVVSGVRAVAIMSVSAMIPTSAAEIVSAGKDVIGPLYRRFTLRSCAVSFPLFMVAAVTSPFLLVAWLGHAPGDSTVLVPFLTFAYLFNVSTGGGSTIARGAGEPGLVAVNAVLIAVVNVVLTVALAPPFGIWGVVAGTVVAISVGSMRFTQRFLAHFALRWSDFLAGAGPTAALSIGLALPPALLAVLVGTPSSRLPALGLLVAGAALYLIPYWLLASRFGYLPEKLRFRRPRAASGESPA